MDKLILRTPAREWIEGLPIGSGRIGLMAWGEAGKECLSLNADTLFRNIHAKSIKTAHLIPELRKLVLEGRGKEADRLYILGDMIDRGPQSLEIVKDVMSRPNVICLLGNHERMVHDHYRGKDRSIDCWLLDCNGGIVTKRAFMALPGDEQEAILDYIDAMPLQIAVTAGETEFLLSHSAYIEGEGTLMWRDIDDTAAFNAVWESPWRLWEYFDIERYRLDGRWYVIGHVPVPTGKDVNQFHEPHIVELRDGTLLGMIRYHYTDAEGGNIGLYVTRSRDGGRTWDMPVDTAFHGAPPHLLRHSSGAIVLVYGWRRDDPGQRARISRDEGETWSEAIVLRADGPDSDLGYPCSVELRDGSILTVYYQKTESGKNTSILWTRWTI